MLRSLSHFEIFHQSHLNLAKYFVNNLKFQHVKQGYAKSEFCVTQDFLKLNDCNFILTSPCEEGISNVKEDDTFNTLTHIRKNDRPLFNKIMNKQNSVFNMSFIVNSIDKVLENCEKNKVKLIKDPTQFSSGWKKAIIKSCIDGCVHSIYENNQSNQIFPTISSNNLNSKFIKKFDHIALATHTNTSDEVIDWFGKIFELNRVKININDNDKDGFKVVTGDSGMRLKAIQNQSNDENKIVFVIVEPLNENKNLLTIFLDENDGPGVQHIGIEVSDLVQFIEETRTNISSKYYVPPIEYFEKESKLAEMNQCELSNECLKRNHILLDSEINNPQKNSIQEKVTDYILQVFTKPLFDRDTFFLEFIQRNGKADGFGNNNIQALWDAVQLGLKKKLN